MRKSKTVKGHPCFRGVQKGDTIDATRMWATGKPCVLKKAKRKNKADEIIEELKGWAGVYMVNGKLVLNTIGLIHLERIIRKHLPKRKSK